MKILTAVQRRIFHSKTDSENRAMISITTWICQTMGYSSWEDQMSPAHTSNTRIGRKKYIFVYKNIKILHPELHWIRSVFALNQWKESNVFLSSNSFTNSLPLTCVTRGIASRCALPVSFRCAAFVIPQTAAENCLSSSSGRLDSITLMREQAGYQGSFIAFCSTYTSNSPVIQYYEMP